MNIKPEKRQEKKVLTYPAELKEKYCKFGINYLMDREVLELLLIYTRPEDGVRTLAEGLITQFGNFQRIVDEPMENLVSSGMDPDTAILLKLAKDFSGYYLRRAVVDKQLVRCGPDLIKYCQMSMMGLTNEQFRVVFLNAQNEITDIEILHEGTIDRSVIYPRKVIERALYHRASALIFVHNHISGSVRPSQSDKELTDTLVAAATSVDLEVYDHIIVGKNRHFSFRDCGLIKAA